jgi:GPH family glycoside/pentoside/hexuronide:cation symporter
MSTPNAPLSPAVKLGYSAGEAANSLIYTLVYVFLLYFLTDVMQLSAAAAGAIVLLGTMWDAVLDPLVGTASDRLSGRWGRRRPFLLAVAVPYGLCAWLLFTDFGLSAAAKPWYFALAAMMFFSCFAVLETTHLALGAEMTPDYDERTSLNGYRAAVSQVASLLAASLPLILAEALAPYAGGGATGGWSLMAGIFAAASVPLILVAWRTTRGHEPPTLPAPTPLSDALHVAWRNRPFMRTLGLYAFGIAGAAVAATLMQYFMAHVMRFGSVTASLAFAVLFGCTVLWVPAIGWLSRRVGKRLAYLAVIGLWALVQVAAALGVGPGDTVVFFGLLALVSGGVVGVYMLGWSMIPDTVEVDEFHSGQRREGLLYGVASLAQKIVTALALGAVGIVLEASGYAGAGEAQDHASVSGIRALYGWGTAALLVVSLAFCVAMPMTRARHAALREAIRRKKAGLTWEADALDKLI